MEIFELDNGKFIDLLTKLISESEFLQNNPPRLVPQEDRVSDHVMALLSPYTKENGGPLEIWRVTFVPGRGNLFIKYDVTGNPNAKTVSFVGSHMDVVPADPSTWDRNPFELQQEGDKLYGRGTTDCLGHVAMLALLFQQLAEKRPALPMSVVACFIANEENSQSAGVGVDMLVKHGHFGPLKSGPLYWVDSADSQPCMGTAGVLVWHLKVSGKLCHSGLPSKGINALELGMECVAEIQRRFYEDFPPLAEEKNYNFLHPSTMKPTQIKVSEGSVNQVPAHCMISGDVRLTPFHDQLELMAKIRSYVDDLQNNLAGIKTRGPCSKYELPEENLSAKIAVTFDDGYRGVACDRESIGHKAIVEATKEVLGFAEPFSISGSLPIVADMKDEGFDLQICGYGKSAVYHGNNEYVNLSDMRDGFRIVCRIIAKNCLAA